MGIGKATFYGPFLWKLRERFGGRAAQMIAFLGMALYAWMKVYEDGEGDKIAIFHILPTTV